MRITKPEWLHHDADKKKPTAIFSVDFHPDGQRLATGGMDNKIRVWSTRAVTHDASPRAPLATLAAHGGAVMCVRFAPGRGQFLASGADDTVVLIWERDADADYSGLGGGSLSEGTEVWRPVRRLTGHASDVCDLAWSPDARFLASCGLDNRVLIWDARTFAQVAELAAHTQFVKGVTFDPAGKYVATQSDDKTLRVWRTSDWALHATVSAPFQDNIFSTYFRRPSWAPDGACIAAANAANGRVPVAAVIQRSSAWPADLSFVGHHAAIEAVRFSPRVVEIGGAQACVCAAAGQDRGVSVWLTSQPVPLAAATALFAGSVFDLAWHIPEPSSYSDSGDDDPVVARLAACSFDGTVALLEFARSELGSPIPIADQGAMLAAHGWSRPYKSARTLAELHCADAADDECSDSMDGRPRPIAETVTQLQLEETPVSESREARIARALEPIYTELQSADPKPADAVSATPELPVPAEPKVTEQAMPVPVRTKDGRKRVAPVFIRPLGSSSSSNNKAAAKHSPARAAEPTVSLKAGQPPSADPPRLPIDTPLWIEARVQGPNNYITKAGSDDDDEENEESEASNVLARVVGPSGAQPLVHAQPLTAARVRLSVPAVVAQLCATGSVSVVAHNSTSDPPSLSRLVCASPAAWTAYLDSPCVSIDSSSTVTAASLADGTLHWLDSASGARLSPPLMLGAPAAVVRCAGRFCLVLGASGLLSVFDTATLEARVDHVSIAPLLNNSSARVPALTGVLLSERGDCVVQLTDGRAYALSTGLRSWLRIADPAAFANSDFAVSTNPLPVARAGEFAAFARNSMSQLEGIQESAQLQHTHMQSSSNHTNTRDRHPKKQVSRAVRASVTLEHLEHQLMSAASIGSDKDVVRFVDLLARRLAQTADHARASYWLAALLGPPLVAGEMPRSDAWAPCLAAVPKRRLLSRMLHILASNRHLQALVLEYSTALTTLVPAQHE
ncbi:HIR complex subunit [Coemansia sp. RSA 2618]|nr:HIR complex subunit [Coemansia sp. RSA 2618]